MKDFLVMSDGSSDDEIRFSCAEALVARFEARMNVVITTELPPYPMFAAEGAVYAPIDEGPRNAALARGNELKETAEQRFSRLGSPVSVVSVHDLLNNLGARVAFHARTHDLAIMTIPAADGEARLRSLVFDRVLIEGGRGILGLAPGVACNAVFDRVTIGWNGSRECSRAVSQAMPFIMRAQTVTVVLVDPKLRRAGDDLRPGDDVIIHLERHGISASLVRVASDDQNVSAALLAECGRIGSDLIVMGAQAEGGLLQWFQSSTSRGVFAASAIPLLVAH